ncbi:rhodanese-related sulfurtransferase [Mesorhizobium sp. Z1-4]|uniref:oxygen-dependent tRNA uridine(34) hydroxylase TrhO n=1 Tax=Mesorhizobium sp. Z1-4 TaxID=2448478 RepID=UPI000FDC8169|nr:rhodanese-related sulfurtransferase [Mesorhizobium sp. Z1-4]
MKLSPSEMSVSVAAFYRFAKVEDAAALRARLLRVAEAEALRGTVLVAPEGINGTIAGTRAGLDRFFDAVRAEHGMSDVDIKFSSADAMPFHRLKVRLKKEIVTMGVADLDAAREAGVHVPPAEWNALVSDPGTVVIDTRNAYETAIGTFQGAIDPETGSFREFPRWAEENIEQLRNRRVAMFCTGGIRCEKASAYLKRIGVEEVFHLKGGILKYLEEVPANESLWQGECFVFDERVGVRHGLEPGETTLCRACRHPLTPEERETEQFQEGVSCPHCHGSRTDGDRERYAERQRQVELAHKRGARSHIGR